jgi:Cu/Ag efflux protein CusF
VVAGPNEWNVEVVENAQILNRLGAPMGIQDLGRDTWVRAEGWQTDDLGLKVVQVRQIGTEAELRESEYNRPDFEQGYVTRIGAAQLTVSPYGVTGTVTRVDRERGFFVLRGDDGKEHTVYTSGVRFRTGDQPSTFSTLKEGDKVTIRGRQISGSTSP